MATKDDINTFIAAQKRAGKSDHEILNTMIADKGDMGKKTNLFLGRAKQAGLDPMVELGAYFGLDYRNTTKRVNQNATMVDKAKSVGQSLITGIAKPFAGAWQGIFYGADKINEFSNKTFGTNNRTDRYQNYTESFGDALDSAKESRRQAGLDGVDLSMIAGEIIGTAPTVLLGGGSGAGARAIATGGKTALAREAAAGATAGAMSYAEDGKDRLANMAFGASGNVVGAKVADTIIAPIANKAVKASARRTANATGATARIAQKLIDDGIQASGHTVSPAIRQEMVEHATKELKKGRLVDVDALYREKLLNSHHIQGTQAQISRNSLQWADERELAKHNTQLNEVHIGNNQQLDELMQKLIADTGSATDDGMAKMGRVFDSLKAYDDGVRANIGQMYDTASQMSGNAVQLNHMRFINNATQQLEDNMLGSFVKGDVMRAMQGMFRDPNFEFSYQKAEELIKILNNRISKTSDGTERYALGIIRNQLEKEIGDTADDLARVLPQQGSDSLHSTHQAFDDARQAYKTHTNDIQNTPTLKDAISGVEAHDGSFAKYILNAKAPELARTIETLKNSPNGTQTVADLQGGVLEYFLQSATKANDNSFSPAKFAKAIDSFGNNRLKILFSKEQLARLNDIRQVADILLQQPMGSPVNHSNTGRIIAKQLMGILKTTGRMPILGNMALGGVEALEALNKSGMAQKMIQGRVPTQKTTLGLTQEQLRRLGLMGDTLHNAGGMLGVNLGVE